LSSLLIEYKSTKNIERLNKDSLYLWQKVGKMNEIILKQLNDLDRVAAQFFESLPNHRHFAFYGEMGAGKTTFIKALCNQLQVTDMVTSPTFAIINEYQTAHSLKVFHFDFYRIKNLEEVYNLGYEDYFYSDQYCFIEWPELVEELLPEHIVKVRISVNANGSRSIRWGKLDTR